MEYFTDHALFAKVHAIGAGFRIFENGVVF
jgi:hypothetical protein